MGSIWGQNRVKMGQNMVKMASKWSQIEYDIINRFFQNWVPSFKKTKKHVVW